MESLWSHQYSHLWPSLSTGHLLFLLLSSLGCLPLSRCQAVTQAFLSLPSRLEPLFLPLMDTGYMSHY